MGRRARFLPNVLVLWFAVPAAFALVAALVAGLQRMGWGVSVLPRSVGATHGALIVCGFLGTLIGLERAVALGRSWTWWTAPGLAALGALVMLAGGPSVPARALFSGAAAALLAAYIWIYRIQPQFHTLVMAGGALFWLIGNVAWWAGLPLAQVTPWWAGFLILTIVGERLELARVLRPPRARKVALSLLVVLFAVGLVLAVDRPSVGIRLAGIALIGKGVWLLLWDVARRTARLPEVTGFAGRTLLLGYVWLVVGGALWTIYGPQQAGVYHDAMLHAVFLGFVMSMIFAHAPIILPALLPLELRYDRGYELHLVLLHVALLVRVLGDLAIVPAAVRWGGLGNVAAVLLFAFNTARTARRRPLAEVRRRR